METALNIRDFILDPETLSGKDKGIEPPKKTKPSIKYRTLFVSGCDFAVEKETPKKVAQLVCMVSQSQFYIKNGENIEPLTAENLQKFCKDIPEDGFLITGENGEVPSWIKMLEKGSRWANRLANETSRPSVIRAFRKDVLRFPDTKQMQSLYPSYTTNSWTRGQMLPDIERIEENVPLDKIFELAVECGANRSRLIEVIISLFTGNVTACCYPQLCDKEYKFLYGLLYKTHPVRRTNPADAFICDYYNSRGISGSEINSCDILYDLWGFEGVRSFTKAFFATPCKDFPDASYLMEIIFRENILPKDTARRHNLSYSGFCAKTEFDLEKFTDYMFFECCVQGCGYNPTNFWKSWRDYMNMQLAYHGEVNDKYSKTLLSTETVLSSKLVKEYEVMDFHGFEKAAERLKKFEYGEGEYVILAPSTARDMIDEAHQQSNCLAGYIEAVEAGQKGIFFCRKKNRPDRSFVTVEVFDDGSLGQVKARFNRTPDISVMNFVNKWYGKFFGKNAEWRKDGSKCFS